MPQLYAHTGGTCASKLSWIKRFWQSARESAYCQKGGRGGEGCSGERVGEEAAGCRQDGRLACGGAKGQRPGRTENM